MLKTKICSKCKQDRPLSDFNKDKCKKDKYSSTCKKCNNKRAREWRKNNLERDNKNARKWNQKFKQKCIDYKGGKCQVCGYNRCLAALDFHHINPNEKEFDIADRRISRSPKKWKLIEKELNKCICVCRNCHQEIHYFHGENVRS